MFHVEHFGNCAQSGKCYPWNIVRTFPKWNDFYLGQLLKREKTRLNS